MAITRNEPVEIIRAELADDLRIEVCIPGRSNSVAARVWLTADEAEQLAQDITDAVIEASVINNEGATA